ncbi:transporter [Massilia sp. YIM B04103]|uniref:transporter n=1 Tax=Massilia sp. YIM B04103 TaxID=2963106 RepID=UPI00210B9D38|nr:transporter [Massilia sp. YIM B04103]
MKTAKALPMTMAFLTAFATWTPANASEDFQLRYNLAGSLGGELFAPMGQTGWAGGLAATYMDINKVTGNDGNSLTRSVPGGTVPLPNLPQALYPTYGDSTAQISGTGSMKQLNLGLAYVTKERFADGRFAFLLNLPFAKKIQNFDASGIAPALTWNPVVPAPVRAMVATGFSTQYAAGLQKQADDASGQVSGIGDTELQAGWLYVRDRMRVLAGASIVLPTGKYSPSSGPDIGYGNYYTFRPAFQATYLLTPEVAISGKVTWAVNTRNRDNQLRSGNWAGVELAAGYKTPLGVLGIHGLRVQQYQDDSNNPWGNSRLRSTNAGIFFTTKLEAINAAITAQYMATTMSRNSKHGDFSQLRMIKFF